MGQIGQGLERALRTRSIPSSTEARLRFLLATRRGSTRKVATVLGVSQRTVQRWVSKRAETRRLPGPLQVRTIEEAVLARRQPRVRARRRAQAEAEGFVFHTRARFWVRGSCRVLGRSAGAVDHPGPAGRGSPGAVRRPGCRRRRAAADGDTRPCAGTRLLSRGGPPGPRLARGVQRCRVRRLLDRLSLAHRASTAGWSASRRPGAPGRHRFVPLGFLPLAPVPLHTSDRAFRAGCGRLGRAQSGRLCHGEADACGHLARRAAPGPRRRGAG